MELLRLLITERQANAVEIVLFSFPLRFLVVVLLQGPRPHTHKVCVSS